jgi:hypothetical protein
VDDVEQILLLSGPPPGRSGGHDDADGRS